jgi:hypothetical protein
MTTHRDRKRRDDKPVEHALSVDTARERTDTIEDLAHAPDTGGLIDANTDTDEEELDDEERGSLFSKGVTLRPPD